MIPQAARIGNFLRVPSYRLGRISSQHAFAEPTDRDLAHEGTPKGNFRTKFLGAGRNENPWGGRGAIYPASLGRYRVTPSPGVRQLRARCRHRTERPLSPPTERCRGNSFCPADATSWANEICFKREVCSTALFDQFSMCCRGGRRFFFLFRLDGRRQLLHYRVKVE